MPGRSCLGISTGSISALAGIVRLPDFASPRRHAGCPVAMVDEVLLSSLRGGRYLLRASCRQQVACGFSWEIDVDDAERTLGTSVTPPSSACLSSSLWSPSCRTTMTALTSRRHGKPTDANVRLVPKTAVGGRSKLVGLTSESGPLLVAAHVG